MLENKEIQEYLVKNEIMVHTLLERFSSLEAQMGAIKEITQTVQSLALDIRELRVQQTATDSDLKELETKFEQLKKDLATDNKSKNILWITSIIGILTAIIGSFLGGVFK